jgi:Xaa-Pro aminopeptidase
MFSKSFFRNNRNRLWERMEDGILLLSGAGEKYRNSDITFRYRQKSGFFFLTGIEEADAVLAMTKKGRRRRLLLFVQKRNPREELWTGERMGLTRARSLYGAAEAFPRREFSEKLKALLGDQPRLYLDLVEDGEFARETIQRLGELKRHRGRDGTSFPEVVEDISGKLAEVRLHKSKEQVELHRQSAEITARAFSALTQELVPGKNERDLEAVLQREFISGGGTWAYEIIVAGGTNALTLHYVRNNAPLRDGELVLVDAGCEYAYHDTDVTRTYPVNGRFTKAQRLLYTAVLKAQQAAMAVVAPGVEFGEIDRRANEVLTEELVRLKILRGDPAELRRKGVQRRYYPHSTSHWLGMDTHDVGVYREGRSWRKLEPGMLLTVEPGLYIPAGDKRAPAAYRGLGVRIEDDLLVTESGAENLTAAIPSQPEELEELLSRSGSK